MRRRSVSVNCSRILKPPCCRSRFLPASVSLSLKYSLFRKTKFSAGGGASRNRLSRLKARLSIPLWNSTPATMLSTSTTVSDSLRGLSALKRWGMSATISTCCTRRTKRCLFRSSRRTSCNGISAMKAKRRGWILSAPKHGKTGKTRLKSRLRILPISSSTCIPAVKPPPVLPFQKTTNGKPLLRPPSRMKKRKIS